MKIADSSFIIALFNKDDEYHRQAEKLLASNQNVAITQAILWEVVEYFGRKKGNKAAADAGRAILKAGIPLLDANPDVCRNGLDLMEKYAKLSYCDAISVAVLSGFKEKQIISFDSDFDFVPGIERIFR